MQGVLDASDGRGGSFFRALNGLGFAGDTPGMERALSPHLPPPGRFATLLPQRGKMISSAPVGADDRRKPVRWGPAASADYLQPSLPSPGKAAYDTVS